jgi:hypothetical protein
MLSAKISSINSFSIFSKIPLFLLEKIEATKFLIVYYHIISNFEVLHTKHLYTHKSVKQFKDDLDFLQKNYNPIHLSEFINFVRRGTPLPEKALLLTFDDGFKEMYEVVSPLLIEKGIPATFFINSDFIDNRSMCYQHKASLLIEYLEKGASSSVILEIENLLLKHKVSGDDITKSILSIKYRQKNIICKIAEIAKINFKDYMLKNQPYMSSDQIRELIKNGFTIGAHSIDHPMYSFLSVKDQLHQTIESLKFIRDQFSLDYGVFAFPHTDSGVTKKFFNELFKSRLIDVTFGTGGMINDIVLNNYQRVSLENPLKPAKKIIAYQIIRKIYKILKNCNDITRQ